MQMKGTKVKSTEHSTKILSLRTGFFAVLRALLGRQGTGALSALLLALGVLALAAGTASANSAHAPSGVTLGSGFGEGAGQLELAAPVRAPEEAAWWRIAGSGVAVDNATHDVYVADTGNHRVDEFESNGTFIRAFGANVGGPGIDTCTLIPGCKAGATGSASGDLEAPKFVAVDNSPGPSHGDVYVGDGVGSEAGDEQQFLRLTESTEGVETSGLYTLSFEGHSTGTASGTGTVSGHLVAATATGDLTAQSNVLSHVEVSSGAFAVGQELSAPGLIAGSTIVAVNAAEQKLELSIPPGASANDAELSAGNSEVTGLSTKSGAFAAGQSLEGPGIPAFTRILSVGSGTLVLSGDATTASTGLVALNSGIHFDSIKSGPGSDEDHGDDAKAALAALESVPGLAGNVAVQEEGGGSGAPIGGLKISFVGALAEKPLPALACDEFGPGATRPRLQGETRT